MSLKGTETPMYWFWLHWQVWSIHSEAHWSTHLSVWGGRGFLMWPRPISWFLKSCWALQLTFPSSSSVSRRAWWCVGSAAFCFGVSLCNGASSRCCQHVFSGSAVESHKRPGNGAPSQRPQDKGEKRHQWRVRGYASGQGEVPDVGGGEKRGSGVERGSLLWPATAAASGRRRWREGPQHAARPGPAPRSGGTRQAARTGCHQPAAAQWGQNPQQDRVSSLWKKKITLNLNYIYLHQIRKKYKSTTQ